MSSQSYWVGIALALFIAVVAVVYSDRSMAMTTAEDQVEKFTQNAAAASVQIETETLADIPANSFLKFYLTCFARVVGYDDAIPTFVPETARWNNFIERPAIQNNAFTVQGTTNNPFQITASKKRTGLSLNSASLVGYSSIHAGNNVNANNYILNAFSATAYLRWSSLDNLTSDIILMKMYAETPNVVEWRIRAAAAPNTATHVVVESTIGPSANAVQWEIQKTMLVPTSGIPVALTLVYNPNNASGATGSPSITLYVDAVVAQTARSLTGSAPSINLGNSEIHINQNKNANANIFAFAFFDRVFGNADVANIVDYLQRQYARDFAAEADLNRLRNEANANQAATDGLLDRLRKCKKLMQETDAGAGGAKSREKPWQVKLKPADVQVDTTALKKCSALAISNPTIA